MPLNLISNFAANVAHRNLGISDAAVTSSLAKLSSGTRVVAAKDDAASLAIGSRLQAERSGLQQALVNAGQAISMLQIADGAMAKVNDILVRMKTLAVQSGSGSLSGTERSMLNTEYQALVSEIDRISNDTEFAGRTLVGGSIAIDTSSATAFAANQGVQAFSFVGNHSTASDATITYDNTNGAFSVSVVDGTATNIFTGSIPAGTNDGTNMTTGTVVTLTNTGSSNKIDIALNTAFVVNTAHATGTLDLSGASTANFVFKVGTGTSASADEIDVTINSVNGTALGVATTSVSTKTGADLSSVAVGNAIDNLQQHRATLGANQNRLEFASANLSTAVENTEAARSQLLDLDVAAEMSNYVSKQILIQAGIAMMSQANQLPANLLRLFE